MTEIPEALLVAIARIPTLRQSIQKVYIGFDSYTDNVLCQLSLYRGITMLAVDSNVELESPTPLDLSTIANGFPALKHLKVVGPSPPAGSLETLKHLESLEITLTHLPDDPDMDFGLDESVLDILPRESAKPSQASQSGKGYSRTAGSWI